MILFLYEKLLHPIFNNYTIPCNLWIRIVFKIDFMFVPFVLVKIIYGVFKCNGVVTSCAIFNLECTFSIYYTHYVN